MKYCTPSYSITPLLFMFYVQKIIQYWSMYICMYRLHKSKIKVILELYLYRDLNRIRTQLNRYDIKNNYIIIRSLNDEMVLKQSFNANTLCRPFFGTSYRPLDFYVLNFHPTLEKPTQTYTCSLTTYFIIPNSSIVSSNTKTTGEVSWQMSPPRVTGQGL